MNLPSISDVAVLEHVIAVILCCSQARVVRQYAHASANSQAIEQTVILYFDLSMLLGNRMDAKAKIVALKIQNVAVSASRIKVNRATVFRDGNRARVDDDLLQLAAAVNHRSEDGKGAIIKAAAPERRLKAIEEDVVARTHFMNAS